MANFKEVFRNEHVILPVIHVRSVEQTLTNAKIIRDAGADGAFLISMEGMDYLGLRNLHSTVKDELPDFWLGANFLDITTFDVFDIVNEKIDGVWADNADIMERFKTQPLADAINEVRINSKWEGLYFGGVAHKYQRPVLQRDLPKAAAIAKNYMDVVTTTGVGTGIAADIEKIKIMKKALGDFPLAIASGISPENVESFMPYANAFLVATSLMESIEYFNPKRVEALIKAVR